MPYVKVKMVNTNLRVKTELQKQRKITVSRESNQGKHDEVLNELFLEISGLKSSWRGQGLRGPEPSHLHGKSLREP